MNKYVKWGLGIFLSPFIIILLLTIAIYLPPVQNWLVKSVASYASEKTGMNISVEHVCLVFPLDLGVDGILVTQKNDSLPQVTDTIASINRLVADVQLLPLLDSKVEIDRFDIYDMKMNTADFIHEARVKGSLGLLSIESHGIDLGAEIVKLDKAFLSDANIDVALSDTVPPDTTKSENAWKIDLSNLKVERSVATIHMPGDTLQVQAVLGDVEAKNGFFDLYEGKYDIASVDWKQGEVRYDNNYEPHLQGLDVNHIALTDVAVGIDSLHFKAPDLSLMLRQCTLKEKSGIAIDSASAKVQMNAEKLLVDGRIITPYSRLTADVDMDLNTFSEENPGVIAADVKASLGKQDLLLAMGDMPKAFCEQWPAAPLHIDLTAKGNTQQVRIANAVMELPTAISLKASGEATQPMDMDRIKAHLNVDARTHNLAFVKMLLSRDMQKMINIPSLHAVASVDVDGRKYDADFKIEEGKGRLSGKGSVNASSMAYTADIEASDIQLQHFVAGMGLGGFSGKAQVKGRGTDVFSPATTITADASVGKFRYDRWNLTDMSFNARLSGGKAHAVLESHNDLLNGIVGFDGLLSRNPVQFTLTTEVKNADLYAMRLTQAPFSFGVCAHLDVATDMKDYYKLQGLVSDLTMRDSTNVYRPDDMVLDLMTRRDTTHAVADCGDFHLNADLHGGYKYLLSMKDRVLAEIDRQVSNRVIDDMAFRKVLPVGHVYLSSGKENPLWRMAQRMGYGYSSVYMDMTSSPQEGINGTLTADTLNTGSFQLDRISLKLNSDEQQMRYVAQIVNGPDNPQYSFAAEAKGVLLPNGTTLDIAVDDAKGVRGIQMGLAAEMEHEGIRIRFVDGKQILGYKPFSVNDDNYVFLSRDMRVSANVTMQSDDGMGIQAYTDDENLEALQDVTLSLHNFQLKELMAVLPYTPRMSGTLDGDFHVIVTPDNLSVSSSVECNKLFFEGSEVGDISSEFVYIPQEDGSHYIDGVLYKDGNDVGTVLGVYNPAGKGNVDVSISMHSFPLDIANGFVPDKLVGLKGLGEGELTIRGPLSSLDVNGEIFLQDAALVSVPYGVTMRFDDDPVIIKNSKLLLENFQMYANNDQPLIVYGDIDFADTEHITMSLRMRAQNFLMVDAKETRWSEAYGKAYVNFMAMMSGELSQLNVRGRLDVLPSTDLYYILRDSPITTDNRLKELVTFTDLQAAKQVEIVRPDVNGLSVDMAVNVMEGAHVKCWLNTEHTNYLDITGGGDLRMGYNKGNLSMRGRYTISRGEMKYSLPIIPLKTFVISEGSYLEFTGDMMNPRLSITATEKNRAAVNMAGVNQMVLFDCGVVISKTLNDMGLEFFIDAPENPVIGDELKSKSLEERGKLAVTMLTTGMYLSENNTSSFTMNSALSSFLQQEISNIAGSALRTLDLSFGLENNTDADGHMHTDYSFKFAKRFWNNRLSISVGGKISTGPDVSGQNNTFFDNVELQYRTSATSNQYLQTFYKRAVYDYLEGYVGEYGAGYMWKRKLQNFRDIFQFGDDDLTKYRNVPAPVKDTARVSQDSIPEEKN